MFWRHVQLSGQFFLYNVERIASYRTDFVVGAVGTILLRIGAFLPVWVVLRQISSMGFWTLPRLGLLYGVAATVRGVHHLLFTGAVNFENHVRNGTLDVLLTRPCNTLLQVYGLDIQLDGFGDLLMGVAFIGYGLFSAGLLLHPSVYLLLLWYIACASLIFGALTLLVAAATIWSFSSLSPAQVIFQLFGFAYYPLDVYRGRTRSVLDLFVPFGLLSYYPTLHVLGSTLNPLLPVLAGVAAAAMFSIAYAAWAYALSWYSSAGS